MLTLVAEGIEQKGRQEGKQEEKIKIAKIMIKKGFSIDSIVEITGLNKAEIEKNL